MSSPAALPPQIRRFVSAYVRRRRRIALTVAAALCVCFALAWILAWAVVDRLLSLAAPVRFALLGCNIAEIALLLSRPMVALVRRRTDWSIAAAQIERNQPALGERLQTVTSQLLHEPAVRGSPQLLAKLTDDLVTDLAAADIRRVAPIRTALKPWIAAASVAMSALALSMLPGLDLPTLIARQLMPWREIAAVTTTRLSVEPGDADVIQGQPL